MADVRSLIDTGWKSISESFLQTLEKVANGGNAGEWKSGLKIIAPGDFINASTGKRYKGAFNRSLLAAAMGPFLDRRAATAKQIAKMGYDDPAAHGIASHAVVLTPITFKKNDEEDEQEDRQDDIPNIVFGAANVFSIDRLRHFVAADGSLPWGHMPSAVVVPQVEWTTEREQSALSIIPYLVDMLRIEYEEAAVKAPHVSPSGNRVVVRMPLLGQYDGDEETRLANRLSSFFHECAHWTGFGGCGDAFRRDMTGGFGSLPYAREELVAESVATAMLGLLGMEETDGFLAKKCAYVGGWGKPLLAAGRQSSDLIAGVISDADKIVAKFAEALAEHPFFAEITDQALSTDQANRIPDSEQPAVSIIPDWRDADGIEGLTPAQIERAKSSYMAKKAKGVACAKGGFDDYVIACQRKRARREERTAA